jgi:hypothetical protein
VIATRSSFVSRGQDSGIARHDRILMNEHFYVSLRSARLSRRWVAGVFCVGLSIPAVLSTIQHRTSKNSRRQSPRLFSCLTRQQYHARSHWAPAPLEGFYALESSG